MKTDNVVHLLFKKKYDIEPQEKKKSKKYEI